MEALETAKMSERGQIIIPKEIREYISADVNTVFTIMPLDRNTIVMKKLDTERILKEFRSLRQRAKAKLSSEEINEEIQQVRKARK